MHNLNPSNQTRILLFDIETAPNISYTWGKWEQDVIAFQQEWYMLCFAYKWLGEKKVHVVSLRHFKRYKKDPTNDVDLIKALHKLFDEADVVVAHNGNSFDIKMAQSKFLMHGLSAPSPFRKIDTKQVAKNCGKFMSNSLDDLGKNLGVGQKMKHAGFSMWLGCMAGNKKQWNLMEKYNKQDVVLLEQVYLKLRSYIPNHPQTFFSKECGVCGSNNITFRGYASTKAKVFRRISCLECGSWGRVLHKRM